MIIGKTIATLAIWILCAGISITALVANNNYGDPTAMVIVPLVAAVITTGVMWSADGGTINKQQREIRVTEKAKRGAGSSKLALLMEMMDDDEREAFKETLKRRVLEDMHVSSDGELSHDIATLESLLDEPRSHRR